MQPLKLHFLYSIFKEGENNTKTVKSSNRPNSIRKERNHFAKSGNFEKFSIGPISLNPGPILPNVVATALKAEKISALQKDITTVENMKMMI